MKRKDFHIRYKRGQKYELDRALWTTYANFHDMYTHNYTGMVKANVAKLLDNLEWKNKKGESVSETQAYGCQVTHQMDQPEYCVVMDEVGGKINMQGDGYIGGETFLCELGVIPQDKSSRNNKHFTLLGINLLSGEPIMCVVIFTGKRGNPVV